MKKSKKFTPPKWMVTLVWVLGILVAWEIGAFVVASTKRTPENVLPHIWQILGSIFDSKKVSNNMTTIQIVLGSARDTLLRAAVGFLLGSAVGFLLALIMKLSGIVEKILFPYLMIIQMIPILGMAPIILSITGDIGVSRIIIAAILTFYPVATSTLAGFNSVSVEKQELMYSYASNRRTIYAKVLIPSAIPYFFTGLKIAAPMAITASILVDTLQGDGGMGCMLSQSLKHAMSIYVFWEIILVSAVVGILSSYLMGLIERYVSPIKRVERRLKKEAGNDD
jgi:ABC-type nitrate/sulfonate/bicarbonate transport system permease component